MNGPTEPSAPDDDWGGFARPAMPERKERLRLQLFFWMLCIDLAAILFAFLCANTIRFGSPSAVHGLELVKVVVPVFLLIAGNNEAYSLKALTRYRYGLGRALTAFAMAIVVVLFTVFYMRSGIEFSRATFSMGIIGSIVTLSAGRKLFDVTIRRFHAAPLVSVVMIHDGQTAPAQPDAVIVDAEAAGLVPDDTDPLMLDRLGRLLRDADRVIVACPEDRRLRWAMALKGANIRGEIVDPEIARLGALGTSSYAGEGTLKVSTGALGLRKRIMKRLLDLALSGVGLVLVLPVLIVTMIAIRLDDGGPILFVQKRSGRGNQLFDMYKFRSMKATQLDHAGNRSASRDDDRITRVGRIIRKTSIDELPQLLNILKGDMSFVGPRPHALGSLAGNQLFWEVDQRYWHRHACKPGLTGLAQVRGFRGATTQPEDLINRLQADLEYLGGWSMARDIRIILATLRVLVHRNAF
ncbi:sugar transferase [Sphingomonas montana]|uniref:sugar transferase n=1 Tax=Sphingomonas montana TaxID=1843236 RepID=UPI00101ADA38|nr:sugar transferase [Sphingomonas montana]